MDAWLYICIYAFIYRYVCIKAYRYVHMKYIQAYVRALICVYVYVYDITETRVFNYDVRENPTGGT
jgi:hypothetical protein